MMPRIAAALLCALPLCPLAAEVEVTGTQLRTGQPPRIAVEGLEPGSRVRVHALRMFAGWDTDGKGGWKKVLKPLHAWADYEADAQGRVRTWVRGPLAGTFAGSDAYGLLWSGRPTSAADPMLPAGVDLVTLAEGAGRIVVSREGRVLASHAIGAEKVEGLRSEAIAQGRLNGHFAAPADGARHPAVILLHGSEGGNRDSAREIAERFAAQGYAAFALNYFAWDLAGLEGVPNAHVNQPIELISTVRDWLAARPEADISRLGLYGHSKGAEYAEVAAVHLPWIKAVAACVPTDAVWEGYGIGDGRNRTNP